MIMRVCKCDRCGLLAAEQPNVTMQFGGPQYDVQRHGITCGVVVLPNTDLCGPCFEEEQRLLSESRVGRMLLLSDGKNPFV